MMQSATRILMLLILLACSATATAKPFAQGSTRVSAILGAGSSFDEEYLILGVGAGYYLLDGLELGLNFQSWLGGDPTMNQITPELTYVYSTKADINPYAGVLYRRTFISGQDDLSAYGGRAGVYIPAGQRMFIGVGGIYLKYSGCSETEYRDCSDSYPEITFSLMF